MKRAIGLLAGVLCLAALAWPQTPHGLLWTIQPVTVDVFGNAIAVSGYNMYCSTSATGPFTKANTALITTATWLQTGLTVGTTWYCRETAVDNALASPESAQGPVSAPANFSYPPAAPAAPVGVPE